jgi:sirohydrochlorin ferrochelatase
LSRAILLVDHGSRRAAANELLEEMAERVRAREPGALVFTAHLEIAEPGIPEGIAACVAAGVDEIVVHPYFLSPGRHTQTDIPRVVEQAAGRHAGVRIRVSEPLGPHDKLVDIILERVAEAGR